VRKILIAVLIPLLMVGCQTTKSANARMAALTPDIDNCRDDTVRLAEANKVVLPQFDDPNQALLAIAIVMLREDNVNFEDCTRVAITSINSDAQMRSALIRGGITLTSLGIGMWGIASVADSFADLGKEKGNTSTVSGSRVVSNSSNSSASGEGLGLLNTNIADESIGIGGLQPRTILNDGGGDMRDISASGTDEPASVDPGDETELLPEPVDPIEPVVDPDPVVVLPL
jgi:hypothetical protein